MNYEPLPCRDCGVDVSWRGIDEYAYVVRDAVWAAAGSPRGYLCVGCIEQRLGRRLTPADFDSAPLNRLRHWQSDRLRSRVAGSGLAR